MLDMFALKGLKTMESPLDMNVKIQSRVKELRLARGWTQEQLGDFLGVSRQSVNAIERERYTPSLPLALAFARAFGVSTDEIFKLDDDRGSHGQQEESKW